jgi:hypothetical protein
MARRDRWTHRPVHGHWAWLALLLWAAVLAWPAALARAQPVTQTKGEPLTRNDFSIDLVTGPIVGPNRVVSLAGAYTALGYGIDNAAITPAAYGARTLWDPRWFEWDVTLDYSPGAFRHTDFDNNGVSGATSSDFLFMTAGGSAVMGELGLGGLVRIQNYFISKTAQVQLIIANYGACYAFLDGQLLIGAAARTAVLSITDTTAHQDLVNFTGTGPELGAILGLETLPFRVGVAARSGVSSAQDNHAHTAYGLTLPRSVSLPPEMQLGFAYQFGERPLNRRWINPRDRERALRDAMLARRRERQREQVRSELARARLRHALDTVPAVGSRLRLDEPAELAEPRDPEFLQAEAQLRQHEERELERQIALTEAKYRSDVRALSRRYILVSADTLLVGSTEQGVGFESFLSQTRQVSGANPSFSARFGAEGEPIANRLKLRAGGYLEPSRFAAGTTRLHATMGFDLRLFAFSLFGLVEAFDLRVTAALDLAQRYRNFGFSVGIWH